MLDQAVNLLLDCIAGDRLVVGRVVNRIDDPVDQSFHGLDQAGAAAVWWKTLVTGLIEILEPILTETVDRGFGRGNEALRVCSHGDIAVEGGLKSGGGDWSEDDRKVRRGSQ